MCEVLQRARYLMVLQTIHMLLLHGFLWTQHIQRRTLVLILQDINMVWEAVVGEGLMTGVHALMRGQ